MLLHPTLTCSTGDGESAAPLSEDIECCTTLPGKKFLLKYNLNKRFIFFFDYPAGAPAI